MVTVGNINLGQRHDVYCGRAGRGREGRFGNPFIVGIHGTLEECCKYFEHLFYSKLGNERRKLVRDVIPKTAILGCFCITDKNKLCHCNTYAEYVNSNYFNPRLGKNE